MSEEDKKYPKELYNRRISTSTGPSVNQLQEYLSKISSGYPGVELHTFTFSGEKGWANIPRQIFEEIARNAKINNVEVTIHAPENDFQLPATDQKGNIREDNMKQMSYKASVILESAEIMSKIYGEPIKVNMHAGDLTLTEWDKDFEENLKKELLNNYELRKSFAEKLYRLGYITSEQYKELVRDNINKETLEKNVPSWAFAKQEAAYIHLNGNYEYMETVMPARYLTGAVERAKEPISAVDEIYKENEKIWMNIFNDIDRDFNSIKSLLNNNYLTTFFGYSTVDREKIGEFLYDLKRYRLFLEKVKEYIDAIWDNINDIADSNLRDAAKNKIYTYKRYLEENLKNIENYEYEISKFAKEIVQNNDSPAYRDYYSDKMLDFMNNISSSISNIGYLLTQLKNTVFSEFPIPIVKPYQEVAIKTAPEVIAEGVRMLIEREISRNPDGWYKDFDKYLSYINIEESYPGAPATRPDIWKKLLNNIREEVKKVIEEYIKDYPQLKDEIEKKYGSVDNFVKERIGATLDVGHIKMFEKYGYKKDDILKWVEEIKPEIRHLHVHETQAGEDTHLALGMGWDDIIASELEKLRDILENKKVTIVHEPGGFYVHQFNTMYGNEYYNLLAGAGPYDINGNIANQFNTMLPYGGTQVIPEYVQYTRYSPYSVSIFSQLPMDLGGTSKRQETFSGEKAD
ncbi:MAG: hypothetical protein RXQ77_03225 [Candidatus Nanopusillus sp.]